MYNNILTKTIILNSNKYNCPVFGFFIISSVDRFIIIDLLSLKAPDSNLFSGTSFA